MEDSGNSSSSTEQQTSTQTTDARVGADNGAVVIQAGGTQNISFSPEVANAATNIVHSVTDFSAGVVSAAKDILNQSITAQEQATNNVLNFGKAALAASPSTTPTVAGGLISSVNFSSLQLPIMIAGGLLIAFLIFKKK